MIDGEKGPAHLMKLVETPPTPTPTATDFEKAMLSDQLGATSGNPVKAGETGHVLWGAQGEETWSRNETHLQDQGKLIAWNQTEESKEICINYTTDYSTCEVLPPGQGRSFTATIYTNFRRAILRDDWR